MLEPCVLPKFAPEIATVVPAGPDVGEIDTIDGTLGGTTHPFCTVHA